MTTENSYQPLSPEEREARINRLTAELIHLRKKAYLSQDEIAGLLGISRQTYSAIETGKRKMSWSVYLAMVFLFMQMDETRTIIREGEFVPEQFFKNVSSEKKEENRQVPGGVNKENVMASLDEQALHTIEMVTMMEKERCKCINGDRE